MVFHLHPDWQNGVRETYSFLTDVFTTRAGKEQRAALRMNPRRAIAFEGWCHENSMRAIQQTLVGRGAGRVQMPDPARRGAALTVAANAGGSQLVMQPVPEWISPGVAIAISVGDDAEFATVGSVTAGGPFDASYDPAHFDRNLTAVVTLAAPLTKAWPMGAVVRPTVLGRLASEIRVDAPVSNLLRYSAEVTLDPPSTIPELGAAPIRILGGYPLMDERPNYVQPLSSAFLTPFETVDYGRGVRRNYLPVDYISVTSQNLYSGRCAGSPGYLLKLFNESKGRRGEFYCPTWKDDLVAASGIAPGGVHLFVDADAQAYRESTVFRTIMVELNDGRRFFRQVNDFQAVGSVGGFGAFDASFDASFDGGLEQRPLTRLTLDNPIFAGAVRRSDIATVCWTPRCRFASDALTLEYMTDDYARAIANITTLEQL